MFGMANTCPVALSRSPEPVRFAAGSGRPTPLSAPIPSPALACRRSDGVIRAEVVRKLATNRFSATKLHPLALGQKLHSSWTHPFRRPPAISRHAVYPADPRAWPWASAARTRLHQGRVAGRPAAPGLLGNVIALGRPSSLTAGIARVGADYGDHLQVPQVVGLPAVAQAKYTRRPSGRTGPPTTGRSARKRAMSKTSPSRMVAWSRTPTEQVQRVSLEAEPWTAAVRLNLAGQMSAALRFARRRLGRMSSQGIAAAINQMTSKAKPHLDCRATGITSPQAPPAQPLAFRSRVGPLPPNRQTPCGRPSSASGRAPPSAYRRPCEERRGTQAEGRSIRRSDNTRG